jgi:hypothetical protein
MGSLHLKVWVFVFTEGFQVEAMPQIFLCYAREDEGKVESLYQRLSNAGFKPWMDKKDLLPGERWVYCVHKAIRCADFFLACLSANSVKKRGFLQEEIKYALDVWKKKLEYDIYLIPVRLEKCEAPESLREFHWVNLFEEDGWVRLVKGIQAGMKRLAAEKQAWDLDDRQRLLLHYYQGPITGTTPAGEPISVM